MPMSSFAKSSRVRAAKRGSPNAARQALLTTSTINGSLGVKLPTQPRSLPSICIDSVTKLLRTARRGRAKVSGSRPGG